MNTVDDCFTMFNSADYSLWTAVEEEMLFEDNFDIIRKISGNSSEISKRKSKQQQWKYINERKTK